MKPRPPRSNRTDTLFPNPTLFRSGRGARRFDRGMGAAAARAGAATNGLFGADGCRRGPGRSTLLCRAQPAPARRSEEHTSELQSLMRISYAVFCLKKKRTNPNAKKTLKTTKTQDRTHQTTEH